MANEYTLEEIDIESDVALLQRYRYNIPVITINGEEVFRHKVRADEFRRRLAGLNPPYTSVFVTRHRRATA